MVLRKILFNLETSFHGNFFISWFTLAFILTEQWTEGFEVLKDCKFFRDSSEDVGWLAIEF